MKIFNAKSSNNMHNASSFGIVAHILQYVHLVSAFFFSFVLVVVVLIVYCAPNKCSKGKKIKTHETKNIVFRNV